MRTLFAVLCLSLASPASAAWRRVDSPNFIVIGDASARELRGMAVKFEAFHEALRRVLPTATTSTPVPTVVVVFATSEAFTPFKPVYQGKPKEIAGYAAAGFDVNYIAMLNGGDDTERVIFHEYTHLVAANSLARLPVWLNEGLADFYSTFALMDGGKRAQIGRPVEEHLRLLNGSLRLPLADLLKVDPASPLYNEGARVNDFYAESWALTHMLLNGEPRRATELGDYLRRVNDGIAEMQAWEAVFGTARTEQDLRQYLKRPIYNTLLVDFAEKVAALPATDRLLSSADTAAFLASLQLRNLGAEAAARLLAPALKDEPANLLVNAAMAQIEIARQDASSAGKRLLGLAGTAGTSDWFGAYSAGVALARTAELERGTDGLTEMLAMASQLLDRVRRDHAELPNVLAMLAKLELLGDAPPSAEARTRIARARTLAPGRIDYALTQAELFANAHEFANARAVIGPLMTSAYPEDVRNTARRLMAGLVEIEKAMRSGSTLREPTSRDSTPAGTSSRSIAVPDADEGKPRDTRNQGRFIPTFRALQPGEQRIDGILEQIDCPAGRPAVFRVRTSAAVVPLEGQMASVEFIAYRNDLTGGVTCGAREPMHVYVSWREGAPPRREKVVVAVEFLPKE
jgi:hypothetical protein